MRRGTAQAQAATPCEPASGNRGDALHRRRHSLTPGPLSTAPAPGRGAGGSSLEKLNHAIDEEDYANRADDAGYAWLSVGENIAKSGETPNLAITVVDGWKNSEGHNRNMLEMKWVEIGVGVARSKSGQWYAVQVFGKPQ